MRDLDKTMIRMMPRANEDIPREEMQLASHLAEICILFEPGPERNDHIRTYVAYYATIRRRQRR